MIKTAKQARAIAKKNESGDGKVKRLHLKYLALIQQTANEGKYVLETHGTFSHQEEEAIEALKEKGFTVTKHTRVFDKIYYEDVYYKISWKENEQLSLWERIKDWFC